MKCAFCGEEDEQKLLLSTRVVGDKVEHVDICMRCWWVKRFDWKERAKNEIPIRGKTSGKKDPERTIPELTKACNL